jgi:hypothetical protein
LLIKVARYHLLDPASPNEGYHFPHTDPPTFHAGYSCTAVRSRLGLRTRTQPRTQISVILLSARSISLGKLKMRPPSPSPSRKGCAGALVQCAHSLPSQLTHNPSTTSIANRMRENKVVPVYAAQVRHEPHPHRVATCCIVDIYMARVCEVQAHRGQARSQVSR